MFSKGAYGGSYYTYLLCKVASSNIWKENMEIDLKKGGKKVVDEMFRKGGAHDPVKILSSLTKDFSKITSIKDLY